MPGECGRTGESIGGGGNVGVGGTGEFVKIMYYGDVTSETDELGTSRAGRNGGSWNWCNQ